jgi:NhaP-type Na+/H+ or K+/H+ antiporter
MDTESFLVIAAGLVAFALISGKLRNTIITPPMIFSVFGLVIGGAVLGVAEVDFDNDIIHTLAELTLIFVLFTDAARIDLKLLRRDHNLPIRLLVFGLPLTIIAGALVALGLLPGFTLWQAALLAAVLAPTDAALGQAVVSSPLVPARIRQALNVESGLNDGIALPVVLLFASLASAAHATVDPGEWIQFGAMQIILGPIVGVIVGWLGAKAADWAAGNGWMTPTLEGPAALGIALIAFAVAEVIGGNGFIGAFVAGLVLGNTIRGQCVALFEFTFLVFGAVLLPSVGGVPDWQVIVYALLSLTVIRMVPAALALIGTGVRGPTTLFLGWFGPRGLASILFALLVVEEAAIPLRDEILQITIVTVALSILAHGLTAAPASRWYAGLVRRMGECEEAKPVSEMPSRFGPTPASQESPGD